MVKVVIGISVVLIFFIIILIVFNNKFKFAIIKINEAENNLDILLIKKLDLLERTVPIIKKELKLEDFLGELSNIDKTNLNHFQLNEILKSEHSELYRTLEEHEKLFKSEALNRILTELSDNEEAILGSVRYYNDNVVIFNHLVSAFPSKLVAFFHHYKKKNFYNDEDKEMYEILGK